MDSGQPLKTLKGHTGLVSSISWSQDGKSLASASWDKTVIIWDAYSGQPLKTLKRHTDGVNSVSWSPDGKSLASASLDKTVIILKTIIQPIITLRQAVVIWKVINGVTLSTELKINDEIIDEKNIYKKLDPKTKEWIEKVTKTALKM